MSKAQEKRELDQYNRALRTMNSKTIDLRERFYESYVSFYTAQLQQKVDLLQEKLEKTTDSYQLAGLPQSIEFAQSKLNRKFTNQLGWIAEAKNNFDAKIDNVSRKLVGFGLTRGHLTVEDTWIESAQEMSFLITGQINHWGEDSEFLGTAHARLIWVNCYDKASHWRFICTLRDKPGTKNNPTEEKVEVDVNQSGLSRKAQVALEAVQGRTARQIAEKLNMNVSYVRTLLRNARG